MLTKSCLALFCVVFMGLAAQQQPRPAPSPIQLTVEQRAELQSKVGRLENAVHALKARRGEDDLVADVEVYKKAGKWLLEFPEDFTNMQDVTYTLAVLDRGMERARLLQNSQAPWMEQKGRKIYGMCSVLDGSVQPYGVNVPDSYDASRPVQLLRLRLGRIPKEVYSFFLGALNDRSTIS